MFTDIKIVIGSNIIPKSEQISSSCSTSVSATNIQKRSCLASFCVDVLNKTSVLLQCSNIGYLFDHTSPAWALYGRTYRPSTSGVKTYSHSKAVRDSFSVAWKNVRAKPPCTAGERLVKPAVENSQVNVQ